MQNTAVSLNLVFPQFSKASDSIFSRLGIRQPVSGKVREEEGLPYLGVLKRPRLQQQRQLQTSLSVPSSGVRASAKSRLGVSPNALSFSLGRSAGVFASETPKTNGKSFVLNRN